MILSSKQVRVSATRQVAGSKPAPVRPVTAAHRSIFTRSPVQQRAPCQQHSVVAQATRTVVDYSAAPGPDVNIEIHPAEANVGPALVKIVEQAAVKAIAEKGHFTLALAGGSLIKMLSGLSASKSIDWSKVYVVYVNHKCVPQDDKGSTHKKTKEALLDKVGVPAGNVVTLTGGADAKLEAAKYEEALKELVKRIGVPTAASGAPSFDIVLLGLGADGHVGSLHPNKPETTQTQGWVLPALKSEGASSITFSHPVISAAKQTVLIVTGAKKAVAIKTILETQQAPGSWPAQLIKPEEGSQIVWLVDSEAAATLEAVKGLRQIL